MNYVGGESDQNKDELCRIAIAYFGKAPNDLFHGLYPTYQELFWTHWPTLKAEIIRNYGDHLVHSSAEEQLMKIRQGSKTVRDHIDTFVALAAKTRLNDVAKKLLLVTSLPDWLKKELLHHDECATLADLVALIEKIDQRFKGNTPTSLISSSPVGETVVPMEIDADSRQTRKNLQCFRCGKYGHIARFCKSAINRPIQRQLAASGEMVSEQLKVPVALNDKVFSQYSALLGSGATHNFITLELATRLQIPLFETPNPATILTIDGKPMQSSKVKFRTEKVCISVANIDTGKHHFEVVDSLPFDIILGMPWFSSTNPYIDWKHRIMVIQGQKIMMKYRRLMNKKVCYCSMNYNIKTGPTLPAYLNDFKSVFDKGQCKKLPPHRPYDISIELEPDASIPFGPIYKLSHDEYLESKRYIEGELAKGFIQPSKSPAGASLLFVKKSDGGLRPCIDYRKLNSITKPDRYPLPYIKDLIERLSKAEYFTKLDLRSACSCQRG